MGPCEWDWLHQAPTEQNSGRGKNSAENKNTYICLPSDHLTWFWLNSVPKEPKKKPKNSWTQSVIPPGELGAWQLVSLSRSWPLPHLCSGAVRWAHFLMSRVSRRKKKTKKHGGLPPAKLKLKSQRIKTICLCVCVCVCAYSRQTHGWLWNDMAKAFLVAKRPPEKNSCVT